MYQYWRFFNASRRHNWEPNGGPRSSFLHSKQGFLVRSLTVPFRSPELEKRLERLSRTPSAIYTTGLLSLPDELLLDIRDLAVTNPEELVMFSMTCRRLFGLSHKFIDETYEQMSAPWAACRIVCAGDSAKYQDLPAALLKANDRAFIEAIIKEEKDKSGNAHYREPSYGGLMRLASEDFPPFRGAFTYKDLLRTIKCDADREMFKIIMGTTFPPERTDWVLCNIAKKEYVRASALAELAGKPNDQQPFLPNCRFDLGHALLTRICWSTDELLDTKRKMKMKMTMTMHRGPWVGDRFYICTMDRWGEPKPGEEWAWKDVSKEVVRDLVQVCRVLMGKQWLKKVEGDVLEEDYWENYWFASDGEDEVASSCRNVWRPWPPPPYLYG